MTRAIFDSELTCNGQTVRLRPMQEQDIALLQKAASDPLIWAGHPAKDRHIDTLSGPYFSGLLKMGGTIIIEDPGTGHVIGCSRYYVAPDRPNDISIGFTFLVRRVWGGTVNFDVKQQMFSHAFGQVEAVWFHIAPDNIRSQKATEKLGARLIESKRLDFGTGDQDWLCYRLTREEWHGQAVESGD